MDTADIVAILTGATALLGFITKWVIDSRNASTTVDKIQAEVDEKIWTRAKIEIERLEKRIATLEKEKDADRTEYERRLAHMEQELDVFAGHNQYMYALFQQHAPKVPVMDIDEYRQNLYNPKDHGSRSNWSSWPRL